MSESNDQSISKYRKDPVSKKNGNPLNIASLAHRIERHRAKLTQLSTELKRLTAAIESTAQLDGEARPLSGKARQSRARRERRNR